MYTWYLLRRAKRLWWHIVIAVCLISRFWMGLSNHLLSRLSRWDSIVHRDSLTTLVANTLIAGSACLVRHLGAQIIRRVNLSQRQV